MKKYLIILSLIVLVGTPTWSGLGPADVLLGNLIDDQAIRIKQTIVRAQVPYTHQNSREHFCYQVDNLLTIPLAPIYKTAAVFELGEDINRSVRDKIAAKLGEEEMRQKGPVILSDNREWKFLMHMDVQHAAIEALASPWMKLPQKRPIAIYICKTPERGLFYRAGSPDPDDLNKFNGGRSEEPVVELSAVMDKYGQTHTQEALRRICVGNENPKKFGLHDVRPAAEKDDDI